MLDFQILVSQIGGVTSTGIALAILCVFLFAKGYRKQVDTIIFSVAAAMFVTYTIKYMLGVPRPLTALVLESDPRFPSGHATIAAVVMTVVVVGLWVILPRWRNPQQ